MFEDFHLSHLISELKSLCPSSKTRDPDNQSESAWKLLRDCLHADILPSRKGASFLLTTAKSLILDEPTCLKVREPAVVVGDLHGQYNDLVKLLAIHGSPSKKHRYLFLGDYVNRGAKGLDIVLQLAFMKICLPEHVYILRGNHECRRMCQALHFRGEVLAKYDEGIYNECMELFDALPLVAVIGDRFLAVHGGLSPDFRNTSQLKFLRRMQETPNEGVMCDILWADPCREKKPKDTKEIIKEFTPNGVRGCSYYFSNDAVTDFLDRNHFLCLIRAHEPVQKGFKLNGINKSTDFPTTITIFSASNYCDQGNMGAVLNINGENLKVHSYVNSRTLKIEKEVTPITPRRVSSDGRSRVSRRTSIALKKKTVRFGEPQRFYIPFVPKFLDKTMKWDEGASATWWFEVYQEDTKSEATSAKKLMDKPMNALLSSSRNLESFDHILTRRPTGYARSVSSASSDTDCSSHKTIGSAYTSKTTSTQRRDSSVRKRRLKSSA